MQPNVAETPEDMQSEICMFTAMSSIETPLALEEDDNTQCRTVAT